MPKHRPIQVKAWRYGKNVATIMIDSKETWVLDTAHAPRSQFKRFRKNHPAEFTSCFTNLGKIKSLLDAGHSIKGFRVGFFRSEGDELYRVGQSGVRGAKESRLYLHPGEDGKTIYILGIGTKETQQQDIGSAKKLIKKIKAAKG